MSNQEQTVTRPVIVVDCETSALVPDDRLGMFRHPVGEVYGVATEVAWHDLSTGEAGSFVPRHDVTAVRAHGAPQALVVSRYLERIADAEQDGECALYERIGTCAAVEVARGFLEGGDD